MQDHAKVGPAAEPSFGSHTTPALPLRRGSARLVDGLRSADHGLLLLALVVGIGAGAGAIVFRWLISTFTRLLSGDADYSVVGHAANPHVALLGRWFVVGAPVVAGLLYGPLVYFFAREARGHGVPEVMFAVARRGGRIAPQVAAVKALASALCIGGGGSVGRERPIVQIGSALGSTLGGLVRASEQRRRVLVACGAAGGIAATFNAPLAGVFFAMELILGDFTARAFGMVVLSSVTASVIGRAEFGNAPFLRLPAFEVQHPIEYLLFALLGLFAGLVGWCSPGSCTGWRTAATGPGRLHGPEWARPAVGGVLLGLLLLGLPQLYGVGYPVLNNGVAGRYALWFLLALLAGKMLATSLTIGIGGSGGVFAPSLFIGAMFGALYGGLIAHLLPHTAGPVGAYGLIGMGAVFAGAARAPITAVVIMFELTGEYSIILPLMAAIVLATGVSNLASRDTIYTLKLRRRGVDLHTRPSVGVLDTLTVADAMQPISVIVTDQTPLSDVAQALEQEPLRQVAIIDSASRYHGVLTARAVAEALSGGQQDATRAGSLAEHVQSIRADRTLDAALDVLDAAATPAVPVLDPSGCAVVGWLTHQHVLAAIRRSDNNRKS